jgi:DNA-binding NarL/FixJ family response regulator
MGAHGTPVTAVLVTGSTAAGGPHTAAALGHGGVELVGTAAAPDALDLVTATVPAVAVVELDDREGLVAVGALAAAAPAVPMLTLTRSADHATVLAAVRAGATSHLAAPTTPAELADAVRRTARGDAVFSPGLADVVLEEFGRPLDAREGVRALTDRESDVLRLVVEGLTAKQIASRLVLSPRTVENHVQNVLRKLQLTNRVELARNAIEQGLDADS